MIFDKNSQNRNINDSISSVNQNLKESNTFQVSSLDQTNKVVNQLLKNVKDFEKGVADKKKNIQTNKSMLTEYEKMKKLARKYADTASYFEKSNNKADKAISNNLWTVAKNYASKAIQMKKTVDEKLGFSKSTNSISSIKKESDKTNKLKNTKSEIAEVKKELAKKESLAQEHNKFLDKIDTEYQKTSLSKENYQMLELDKKRDDDLEKVKEYQSKNIITEDQAVTEKTKINNRYLNEKKKLEAQIEEKRLKTIADNAKKEKQINENLLKEERTKIISSKNQELDSTDDEIKNIEHKSDIQQVSEEEAFNTYQELNTKKKNIYEDLSKNEKLSDDERLQYKRKAAEIERDIEKNNFDYQDNLFQEDVVKRQELNDSIQKIVQERILNTANLELQSLNDNREQVEHNFELSKISAKDYFSEIDKLNQEELNTLEELAKDTRLSEEQKLDIKREIAEKERDIEKESFDESVFYIDQRKEYLDTVSQAMTDLGKKLKDTNNEVTQSIGGVFSSLGSGINDISAFFTQFDKLSLLAKGSVESNLGEISLVVSGLEKNVGFFSSIIGEEISLLKKVKDGETISSDSILKSTGNMVKNIPVIGEFLASLGTLFTEGFGSSLGIKTDDEVASLKKVQEEQEATNAQIIEDNFKIEKLKASWHDDELERIEAEYDAEIDAISQSKDSEILKEALKTDAYKKYEKEKTTYFEKEQSNRDKIVQEAYELEKKAAEDYFTLRKNNENDLIKQEQSKLKTIQDEIDKVDETLNSRNEDYQKKGEINQKFQSDRQSTVNSLSSDFYRTPVEKFELDMDSEKSNVQSLFDSGLITQDERTNKLANIALKQNIFYSNIAKNLVKGTKEHLQYQKLINGSYSDYYDLVSQTSEDELLNEKNLLEEKKSNIQSELDEKTNALAVIEEQEKTSLANLEDRYKTSAGVWRDSFIQANNEWSADINQKLTDFQNKIQNINTKIGNTPSQSNSSSTSSINTKSTSQSYTSSSPSSSVTSTTSNSSQISSSLENDMQRLGIANTKRGRIVTQLAEKDGILDYPLTIYQRYGSLSESALEDVARKANIPIYHTGGVAEGGLSLLQKGELVLTKQMQENMFSMITNPSNSNTANNISINLNGQINASNKNDVFRLTEQIKNEIAKNFRKQI